MKLRPRVSVQRRSTREALPASVSPGISVVAYSRSSTVLSGGRKALSMPMSTGLFAGSHSSALKPASDSGLT